MNDSRDYWFKLQYSVEIVAREELERANERYPMFRTMYEGYVTLLKEYDEARDELRNLEASMTQLRNTLKSNHSDLTKLAAICVERLSQHLACEAIQCAAMARKLIESQKLIVSQKLLDNQPE